MGAWPLSPLGFFFPGSRIPSGLPVKYSMAFVGYGRGNQDGQAELELTFNYGVEQYALGTAYGHIAIAVPDIAGTCERIRALGGTITREPGPVSGGTTVIAFVQDPDGYKIELIERVT